MTPFAARLVALVFALALPGLASADVGSLESALGHLQSARNALERGDRKGAHRKEALQSVEQAISAVRKGIEQERKKERKTEKRDVKQQEKAEKREQGDLLRTERKTEKQDKKASKKAGKDAE